MTLVAVLRAPPELLSEQGTLSLPSPQSHHCITTTVTFSDPVTHLQAPAKSEGYHSHLFPSATPSLTIPHLTGRREPKPTMVPGPCPECLLHCYNFFFPSHLQALYSPVAVCSVWRQGWAFSPAHLLLLMQRHQRAGIRCYYSSCKWKHRSHTTMWMLQR